ncbi:MAG TPA: tetratricopeptide repeat protein [Xanthobacteraceae bacterium]|nr:tetratricopeptide repeat protein [Xanthobacteraceae bacterium]
MDDRSSHERSLGRFFGRFSKRHLLPALIAALALCAAPTQAAFAQGKAPAAKSPEGTQDKQDKSSKSAARKNVRPSQRAAVRMNALYDALERAPNAAAAKAIETRIEIARMESGSATADLLMSRVRMSLEAKDNGLALELLNSVVDLAPNFIEARAQRATLYYESKDVARALADLRVIVAKDPRHYTALTGLGIIFGELDQDKLALEAFRRAMKVNPHIDGVTEIVKKLQLKVEGREI